MILSDRSIRKALAEGRIAIEPLDESSIQPSSVDLHVDRYFRVFRNHTMGYIDVKENQEDLTELVEIGEETVFILHPGEFVLGSTAERVQLPDDLVARLEGKALALDTPVPTPSGWKAMGDLRVGDEVFDERGRPTNVVGATPPMFDRPCREVVFSDDTTVVADAGHQWLTCDATYGCQVGGSSFTSTSTTLTLRVAYASAISPRCSTSESQNGHHDAVKCRRTHEPRSDDRAVGRA